MILLLHDQDLRTLHAWFEDRFAAAASGTTSMETVMVVRRQRKRPRQWMIAMVVRLQRTRTRRWTAALVVRRQRRWRCSIASVRGGTAATLWWLVRGRRKDVEEEEETDVGKKGGSGMDGIA